MALVAESAQTQIHLQTQSHQDLKTLYYVNSDSVLLNCYSNFIFFAFALDPVDITHFIIADINSSGKLLLKFQID